MSYKDMSRPEKAVAKFLRDQLDLWWHYEFPIFVYDEKKRPRVWTPDFFLPKLGMYVEVVGSEKAYSDKSQNYQYRQKIFEANNCIVIFVHYWKKDWKSHLIRRIHQFESQRYAEVQKMLESVL